MTWKPLRDAAGEVSAIVVSQTIDGAQPPQGQPFSLVAPLASGGVTGIAERITELDVADAEGPLLLRIDNSDADVRRWLAPRPVRYPVRLSYRALVQPPGGRNGPPYGIRPAGGGVSGSPRGFLLLPENAGTTLTRVHWDLSGLAAGSVAASSFGDGDFTLAGSPDALGQGWLLAGPAQQLRAAGAAPFRAYWLGQPPFDAAHEMDQAARGYQVLSDAFPHLKPTPSYRLFMRVLDTPPPGGGTALQHSFMLSMGKDDKKGALDHRNTMFHEMSHQWVGLLDPDEDDTAWFKEGLNVYYTTVLRLRGGLSGMEEYAAIVNAQLRTYYASHAINWSAEKIAGLGLSDEAARQTPYVRGWLYFVDLDGQLRAHSGGKMDLDSFLKPLFLAREQGRKIDVAYWEAMLDTALGPQAVRRFRAVNLEATEVIHPAAGAFGPCLTRQDAEFTVAGTAVQGYRYVRGGPADETLCRIW